MVEHYHSIIVGTGFASSFFLREHLRRLPADARVLVLERGSRVTHRWQVENRRHGNIDTRDTFAARGLPDKRWNFTVAFGGGSNCWWAVTPRMMPNDFRLHSTYGVGVDWPLGYDDLEPIYQEVEEVMQISGSRDGAPFPRSAPYPQPPHRFSDPDRLFKARYPDLYFPLPTARARVATKTRPACCANGVCSLCPVDAKFTIENGMAPLYDDPRVRLLTEAEALAVEFEAGRARGISYRRGGIETLARTDLVVLGANALFNPFLLMRSGVEHPALGRYLCEQHSLNAFLYLDGVEALQGSTSITGHGYMLYDGAHRARHAATLIESYNLPRFRHEFGRWREFLRLRLVVEDMPLPGNRVEIDPDLPNRPRAVFERYSDYALAGLEAAKAALPGLVAGMPVERIAFADKLNDTESHIIGTARMGDDPADSVVDRGLRLHRSPNLLVLGSSAFPTCAPANPTLTLSALSIWAARQL